jgi:predicted nucleic acid-binding protein
MLDTGPLGLACNPMVTPANGACKAWLTSMLAAGARVVIPQIADYEVRRGLLVENLTASVTKLDELIEDLGGLIPVSPEAWTLAASLWAGARARHQPTAPLHSLDGDVILAATATVLEQEEGVPVIVATTNVGHLARFVAADLWSNIAPPV